MTSRLLDALANRPLLLDGGMGTRLIELGLDLQASDPAISPYSRSSITRASTAVRSSTGSSANR